MTTVGKIEQLTNGTMQDAQFVPRPPPEHITVPVSVLAERDALRAEVERLTAELQKRATQIGVACHTHDLTHALACGRCADEARAEVERLRAALEDAPRFGYEHWYDTTRAEALRRE
jgi:hypothetical protein